MIRDSDSIKGGLSPTYKNMRQLRVHLLPALVEPEALSGWSVVVIDILRASTTICHALAAGARQVVTCADIAEARALAGWFTPADVLLGGERGGVKIEGFDLGNSPREYKPGLVGGKTIVFTTTNGTQAVARASHAAEIVIGCFNNIAALTERLAGRERIAILCAGTEGRITAEDVAAAGAIAERLLGTAAADTPFQMNDEAQVALRTYAGGKDLDTLLRASHGGRNVLRLGFEADLPICAAIDSLKVVPRYDASFKSFIA